MPVPGLWHTGAGADPLATLNGWSGRTAAPEILGAGQEVPLMPS